MGSPDSAKQLRELRQQNDDLRAQNTSKDEFIALASHQLRTPATAVKQFLGMLLEGYMGDLAPLQVEFVQKAYDSNERQLSIINDLLQVAQIDSDTIVLRHEACDIKALITTIAQEQRRLVKDRQQRIIVRNKTRMPLFVYADLLRLRMVFDNLVDNASKYSANNTTVTLTIDATETEAIVHVTDRGVGIAEADMPKLFQKFSRIPNPRSIMVGGSGIGLYLVKRIIDAHGGTITVDSQLTKGTTFTVYLPRYYQKV